MRLLVLIMAHDNEELPENGKEYSAPCFNLLETFQRNYVHRHSNIDSYFIKAKRNLSTNVSLKGDTLYVKGEENRGVGLIKKCLAAYSYFLNPNNTLTSYASGSSSFGTFDYILKTTCSSFKILEKVYSLCLALGNARDVYMGHINFAESFSEVKLEESIPFVRGDCILFSKDVIHTILNNPQDSKETVEDLYYGEICHKHSIPAMMSKGVVSIGGSKWDIDSNKFLNNTDVLNEDIYSVKVMCKNRDDDLAVHASLINKYLSFKFTSIVNFCSSGSEMTDCLNIVFPSLNVLLASLMELCDIQLRKPITTGDSSTKYIISNSEAMLRMLLDGNNILFVFISGLTGLTGLTGKDEITRLIKVCKFLKKIRSIESFKMLYVREAVSSSLDSSLYQQNIFPITPQAFREQFKTSFLTEK